MAKKSQSETVALVCKECKSQNYITKRNKMNLQESKKGMTKLELNKYCKKCKKYTLHKESSKLK